MNPREFNKNFMAENKQLRIMLVEEESVNTMVQSAHKIGILPPVAPAKRIRPPFVPGMPLPTGEDRYEAGARVNLNPVIAGIRRADDIATSPESIKEGERIVSLLSKNPELKTVLTYLERLGFKQLVLTEKELGDLSSAEVNEDNIAEIRNDDNFSWAEVDDAIIFFNPEFTQRRSDKELLTILEHELWHMFEERTHPDAIDGLHNTFNSFEVDELEETILMSIKHLYLLVDAHRLGRRKFAYANIALRKRDVSDFLKRMGNEPTTKFVLFFYISQMLEMAMAHRLMGNSIRHQTSRWWLRRKFRKVLADRDEFTRLTSLGNRYTEELFAACTYRSMLKTHGVEEDIRNVIGRILA
jgi:hypothetical protein